MNRSSPTGMTLIELLVAMVIFTILSGLAYGGLQSILLQREGVLSHGKGLSDVQMAFFFLQRDVQQIVPTLSHLAGNSDNMAMMQGDTAASLRLIFIRGGVVPLPGSQRSSLRKVSYHFADGILWRKTENTMGEPMTSSTPLLDNLTQFQIYFLDHHMRWRTSWPEPSEQEPLPRALRVVLQWQSGEEIHRIFSVQG